MGMMYGWRAADELEKFDHTPNHVFIADAWKLINYRYSFKEIGTVVAFTLNYLAGAAQNERILQIAQGQSPQSVNSIVQLYQNVSADKNVKAQKAFAVSFGNIVTSEFYAVSQNSKLPKKDKLVLLAEYLSFIDGLREGQNKAADQIYIDTAGLFFGLGYAEGFKDGYTAGYVAGWKDGYASGYAAAWSTANIVITGLQQQITFLQNQLDAVQQSNSGGGSGDGFWNNIGSTVSTIGSVVGTIASFF